MSQFKIYAPLRDFRWQGSTFSISPGIEIIPCPPQPYPLRGLDEHLAQHERHELYFASHWLAVDWSTDDEPEPAELVNIFLLALWLAQPTKAYVSFRFKVATDPEASPGGMSHLLDQFSWVEGAVTDEVTNAHLATASSFFPSLREIRLNASRLSNALYLTLAGCQASRWQVGLVCYAAAAEAILAHGRAHGITKRLALAYACLIAQEASARNRHYREFLELYDIRSDVVHGIGHTTPDQLPTLARFGGALRQLWKSVISSPVTIQELDAPDARRKAFFNRLQGSYSPPP